MKISKSSWHYKLIKRYEEEPANNLCVYFWQVVLGLLIPVFIIGAVSFIIFFIISDTLIFMSGVIGFILFVLFLVYVGLPLYDKYIEPFYNKYIKREPKPLKPKKDKKPNLTIEYLKAKKQKICPILEWEE